MIKKLGESLTFFFEFTAEGAGKAGLLDIGVDVYDIDHSTKLVTAAAAVEIAQGFYYYTLAAAANDAAGEYLAIAHTDDITVDIKDVGALWSVRGHFTDFEYEGECNLDDTLAGLLTQLRIRLDDVDKGAFPTDQELMCCINWAKRDTELYARCNIVAEEVSVGYEDISFTTTYVFDAQHITIDGTSLTLTSMEKAPLAFDQWREAAPGLPTQAVHFSGDEYLLHPAPDDDYVVKVDGYGYGPALSELTDKPISIPTAFRVPIILSRAEAYARRMHSTDAENHAVAQVRDTEWSALIQQLRDAVKK